MNNQLNNLIGDYQESVMAAIALMRRSGINMPYSSFDWIKNDTPFCGELDCGVKYYKHGAGCLVSLHSGEVDFDFGEQGEIGGFNAWWLFRFAKGHHAEYGFSDIAQLAECMEKELNKGELTFSNDGLYYVANTPKTYAIEKDCRLPGDLLPDHNQDRILVLQSHYFQAAELMFENYGELNSKLNKNNHLSRRDIVHHRIYLFTWLGFLGVTCEGFRNLNMRLLLGGERPSNFKELIPLSDDIGRLMKIHADSLRGFRNNVFHLRENPEVVRNFFANNDERLPWAHELHASLERFFSEYRILCEVHYIINGRKSESDLRRKRTYRKKISF